MLTFIFGFWINLEAIAYLKSPTLHRTESCSVYFAGQQNFVYYADKTCKELAEEINRAKSN